MVGVVDVSDRVVTVVVQRTVIVWILTQYTSLDNIPQDVDSIVLGQSDLLAGGLIAHEQILVKNDKNDKT